MNARHRERPRPAGLRARLRARAAAWFKRRQGDDSLPLAIGTRRVYILPTRAGYAFALLLATMLLAGLNYSNSVALGLTFLMGGFALIAMHLTHRNLVGLRVRAIATSDAFAGEHGQLHVTLENAADTPRIGIDCETAHSSRTPVDVPARATARADIAVPLEHRGRLPLERIELSTAFPFGLFRAWTYTHLALELLAWPVPRGRREPPPEAASGGQAPSVHRAGDEEWAGLREFRSGDSPRQIAWSAFARGRGLLVKVYESPVAHHRTFDLAAVPGADIEARLEQLSAWIVAAHARGERYGLRAGARDIPPDAGHDHRARCLAALAVFGDDA